MLEFQEREECWRREQEERDMQFQQTLNRARQQSEMMRQIMDEDAHAMRRDDMREAYMEHGREFDPCPIQEPQGLPANYQAIAGPCQPPPGTWNQLLGLDCMQQAQPDFGGANNQLVGGVCSPPQMLPSRRTASEILQTSPPVCQEDMELTPAAGNNAYQQTNFSFQQTPPGRPWTDRAPAMDSPEPRGEHQELLNRVKRTVEEASRQLNITPSSKPHPLSYGFSSQPQQRQPLAELYSTPQAAPGPSRLTRGPRPSPWGGDDDDDMDDLNAVPSPSYQSPPAHGPTPTRGAQPTHDFLDDPRLQYRSRLSSSPQQAPQQCLPPQSTRGPSATRAPSATRTPSGPCVSRAPSGSGTRAPSATRSAGAQSFRWGGDGGDDDDDMDELNAVPSPSYQSPPAHGPTPTRGAQPTHDFLDDPRLQYRSRLSSSPQQAPQQCLPPQSTRGPTATRAPSATRTPSGPCVSRAASATRSAGAHSPAGRPAQASVQDAIAAGTFAGTQQEMEAMGFQGQRSQREMMPEYDFADQYITAYQGPAPEIEEEMPGGCFPGLIKQQAPSQEMGAERKKRVMLKRKVIKVTIPPRPDPGMETPPQYMYQPGDPQYGVRQAELLPPRRLTPSPPPCYGDLGVPRTTQQLQSRRDLEADWERRQEAVPSREYSTDKRDVKKPRPKSYTTGKSKKHQYYRGGPTQSQSPTCPQPTPSTSFGMAMGGAGRPQTPTTRTGLPLRPPSTPTTTRAGSVPSRGAGRGGAGPTRRCVSAGQPTRGRPPSRGGQGGRGGRGGSASPSPTRAGTPVADHVGGIDVTEVKEHLDPRVMDLPNEVDHVVDKYLPDVMNYVHQGEQMVNERLGDISPTLQDIAQKGEHFLEQQFSDLSPVIHDAAHQGAEFVQQHFDDLSQKVVNKGEVLLHHVVDDPHGAVKEGFDTVRQALKTLEEIIKGKHNSG